MQLAKNSYTDSVEKMLAKAGVTLPGQGLHQNEDTNEFLVDAADGLTCVGYSITDAYNTCLMVYGQKIVRPKEKS